MSDEGRSPRQIETEIEATRERLAGTIDELTYRTQPAVIARRQKDQAQLKLQETFTTPQGDLRVERVAAVAVVVVAVVALAVFRRVR